MFRRSTADAAHETRSRFDLRAVIKDDGRFRQFYEETSPRVYAFLYSRTGSKAIAEELTQETFVEIIRNPRTYDGRSDPIPWMMGVARHRLLRHVRATRRDNGRARELVREIDTVTADYANAVETRDLVSAALQQLTLDQRTVLMLRFVDDLPVREVARAIGRSEHATESLLRRARASFEAAFHGGRR